MMLTDIHGVIAGPGADQGGERRALRASLDAVYQQLKDGDTMGAALAMEGVLKGIDYLSAAQPVAQEAIPPGYVLISIDALRVWGKLDEVQDACKYSLAAPQPSQGAEDPYHEHSMPPVKRVGNPTKHGHSMSTPPNRWW